jgi:C1A family cysteine protease
MSAHRRYGWIPDIPDIRDHICAMRAKDPWFPQDFSLREKMPAIYDQGPVGSCVWNAAGSGHEYAQDRQPGGVTFTPSRLAGYWWTRLIEGTTQEDAGCCIRNAMKVIADTGVCPETEWPYIPSKFAEKPSDAAEAHAANHKAIEYARVPQTKQGIMECLYTQRFPVIFGATLYESFESEKTAESGVVPFPLLTESVIGGHAMTIVGWRHLRGTLYFEIRNSCGERWGDHGHAWMPAAYVTNIDLCADFWRITLVMEEAA